MEKLRFLSWIGDTSLWQKLMYFAKLRCTSSTSRANIDKGVRLCVWGVGVIGSADDNNWWMMSSIGTICNHIHIFVYICHHTDCWHHVRILKISCGSLCFSPLFTWFTVPALFWAYQMRTGGNLWPEKGCGIKSSIIFQPSALHCI